MWDRLRGSSSGTSIPVAPTQQRPGRHPADAIHKNRLHQLRHFRSEKFDLRGDRELRRDFNLDHRGDVSNVLGILDATAPNRYEVRRGKLVPRSKGTDLALPSQTDNDSPPSRSEYASRSSFLLRHSDSSRTLDAAGRPTSSVYTTSDIESSPAAQDYKLVSSMEYKDSAAYQISPPSSPDVEYAKDEFIAGDVSPIDSDVGSFQRAASRREAARQASDASKRQSLPLLSSTSRDRDMVSTGPPSNVNTVPKGQRPQVRQQVHTGRDVSAQETDWRPREGPRSSSALGFTSTTIHAPSRSDANLPPSFGRRSRLFGRAKPEPLDSRPPWKGASGRTKAVQPMHDDTHVAPLNIPSKPNKRAGRASRMSIGPLESETHGVGISSAGAAMRRLLPLGSRSSKPRISAPVAPQRAPPNKELEAAAMSYPSPPHAGSEEIAPASSPTSHGANPPSRRRQALMSNPPDLVPAHLRSMNSIRRKPAPLARPMSEEVNVGVDGMTEQATSPKTPIMSLGGKDSDDDAWVQPPSRFSVTTCATSDPGTPRQSAEEDQPPLPAMPANVSSIMDRKRPKITSQDSTSTTPDDTVFSSLRDAYSPREHTRRRPSDSQLLLKVHKRSVGGMADGEDDRRASILSLSKPLPPAPPEMTSSSDSVSMLSAQIQAIVHRRANIEKGIKVMTELMPQDRLLASDAVLRRREVEKQKVEGLRTELAELQREEHDLGLKLHRAYKRQEREAYYEPTGLWVRRVAA